MNPEQFLDPQQPWYKGKVGDNTYTRLKWKLIGGQSPLDGTTYSSFVRLSEADADTLISNLKKEPRGYPQLNQTGAQQGYENLEAYQKWLVDEYLEKPFREQTNRKIQEAEDEARLRELRDKVLKKKTTPVAVEETAPDEKEVKAQVQAATEVLEDVQKENQKAISADMFDDLPEGVRESLIKTVNRRTDANLPLPEKQKKESFSNQRILTFLNSNIGRIQSQLSTIDKRLQEQNELLRTSLGITMATYQGIANQDEALEAKFDAILAALDAQQQAAKDYLDAMEDEAAKNRLDDRRDGTGTSGFDDLSGGGGGLGLPMGLLRRLGRFLGRRLLRPLLRRLIPRSLRARARLARMTGKRLLRNVAPRAIASRMTQSLAKRVLPRATQEVATSAATNPRVLAKGFEHIALPGASRAITGNLDDAGKFLIKNPMARSLVTATMGPLAPTVLDHAIKPKSGLKIFQAALTHPKVQKAIITRGGRELLEKVIGKGVVKVGGNAVPSGIGQAVNVGYGLVEGIVRASLGDPKGAALSFGGAIPFLGAGFSVIDIFRDIDIDAYTKHIEPNLGAVIQGDGKPMQAFFNEIVGEELQYEYGTKDAAAGKAELHGAEWVGTKQEYDKMVDSPFSNIGSSLIVSTSSFINGLGPAGSNVSRELRSDLSRLADVFGVSPTMVGTNVGGSFPNAEQKVRSIKDDGSEAGLTSSQKSILNSKSNFGQRLAEFFKDKLQALSSIINTGGIQSPLSVVDHYTGEIEGDTFMPLASSSALAGQQPGQEYGNTTARGGRKHLGIDVTENTLSDSRAPIVAYKTGRVTEVSNTGGGPGGIVHIDHGDGTETRYLHVIPRAGLKSGDEVYGGQHIANLFQYFDGGTEMTHLHFEAYADGKLVNPTRFLSEAKNRIPAPLTDADAKSKHEQLVNQPTGQSGTPMGFGKVGDNEYYYLNGKYFQRKNGNATEISEAVYNAIRKNHPSGFGLAPYKEYTLPSSGEVKLMSNLQPPQQREQQIATAQQVSFDVDEGEQQSQQIILLNNMQTAAVPAHFAQPVFSVGEPKPNVEMQRLSLA